MAWVKNCAKFLLIADGVATSKHMTFLGWLLSSTNQSAVKSETEDDVPTQSQVVISEVLDVEARPTPDPVWNML